VINTLFFFAFQIEISSHRVEKNRAVMLAGDVHELFVHEMRHVLTFSVVAITL
jgi:hypothetical protein